MARVTTFTLTPEQRRRRAEREPKVCSACRGGLGGMHYFCRRCFFLAPANDRTALYSLHHHGHDCTSKVAKMVRRIHADHPELIPHGFPGAKPPFEPVLVGAEPGPIGPRIRLATKQEADVLTALQNAKAKAAAP